MFATPLRIVVFATVISLVPAAAVASSTPQYPAATINWTAEQYTAFNFTHYNTNLALPHLRTSESRALFERLVSRDNVEAIVAGLASHDAKMNELGMIIAAMGGVRASYNYAVIVGEPLQEELTQVQAFNLYLLGTYADLAGGDISTAPSSSAMKTAFIGVVQSMSEESNYSAAQITTLSDALARRYVVLSALFNEPERQNLERQVSTLRDRQSDPGSRNALARLVATMDGG